MLDHASLTEGGHQEINGVILRQIFKKCIGFPSTLSRVVISYINHLNFIIWAPIPWPTQIEKIVPLGTTCNGVHYSYQIDQALLESSFTEKVSKFL